MSVTVIAQRLLLFFTIIACCKPAYAQLPCCQVLPAPGSPFSVTPVGASPTSVAFSPITNCLAVTDAVFGNISLFTVNSDCSLTPVGAPANVGFGLTLITFSPTSNCLAALVGNGVSLFTVNDDCSLNRPAVSSVALSGTPTSIAFSPNGDCLAVANNGNMPNMGIVSTFIVDPATCSFLQSDPVSTISVGNFPRVAFSPSGTCLAVASNNPGPMATLSMFSIDSATCSADPNPVSTDTIDLQPSSIAFSINNCLAITSQDSGTVSTFTFDPTTCIPSPVSTTPTGQNPASVAFSSNGNCLAVANRGPDTVSIFTVNPDCSLTEIEGSSFDTDDGPSSVAFSPISNCLAVANAISGNISVFRPLILLQPTITSTVVTNCNVVTVAGTADPNATITLFVDGIVNTMGIAEGDGSFSIDTTPLSAGTHSITAVATVSGCTSTPSMLAMVTIATPTITSATVGCGNFVTIIGTSAPDSTVSIAVDNVPIATGMTNSEGTFVFAGIQLSSGMHCITATDIASGCTSAPVCIDVSPFSCVLGGPNLAFGTHCNR